MMAYSNLNLIPFKFNINEVDYNRKFQTINDKERNLHKVKKY